MIDSILDKLFEKRTKLVKNMQLKDKTLKNFCINQPIKNQAKNYGLDDKNNSFGVNSLL